jgi:hypothetical protein
MTNSESGIDKLKSVSAAFRMALWALGDSEVDRVHLGQE